MNTSVGDSRLHFRQEDAAMHQLARAIRLFLDERDYLCAITLAGAADGILGETLQARAAAPALEAHVAQVTSAGSVAKDLKRTRDNFNRARNLLKHKKVHVQQEVSLAVETEAVYLIARAIDNAVRLGHEMRAPLPAFIEWVYSNRPDLVSSEAS